MTEWTGKVTTTIMGIAAREMEMGEIKTKKVQLVMEATKITNQTKTSSPSPRKIKSLRTKIRLRQATAIAIAIGVLEVVRATPIIIVTLKRSKREPSRTAIILVTITIIMWQTMLKS
jgi:hypothetical protein